MLLTKLILVEVLVFHRQYSYEPELLIRMWNHGLEQKFFSKVITLAFQQSYLLGRNPQLPVPIKMYQTSCHQTVRQTLCRQCCV